jgi:hypothetical protein
MQFHQVFGELDEFMATYQGAISREGMLLHSDVAYLEGTVLNIEILLEDTLPLIRGTAGVVKLVPADRSSRRKHTVVLEFLQLDEESDGFVDRLVTDLESTGVAPFSFYQYLEQGRRGVRRSQTSPFDDGFTPPPISVNADATSEASPASAVESEDGSALPGSRGGVVWRWFLGVAASCAVIVGLVVVGSGIWPQLRAPRETPPGSYVAVAHGRIDVTAAPLPREPGEGVIPVADEPLAEQVAPSPATASRPGSAANIERVDWTESERTTEVTIQADGALDGAAVGHFLMLDDPQPRLIIYLYGIGSNGLAYRTEVEGGQLAAIRVWYHDDKSPVQLHIVLDFTHRGVVSRAPVIDGDRLLITLFDGSASEPKPSS